MAGSSDAAIVHGMKTATYRLVGGGTRTVEYDADAPCWMCGEPVVEASMGGTVVCPSCDCGIHRDGRPWTLEDAERAYARFREQKELHHAAA